MNQDLIFMNRAFLQAQKAYDEDEVPVGAVLVKDGEIIAESYNKLIQLNDPTSHAEINVIRRASQVLNNYRLNNTSLYVTLEPCHMCAKAIVDARIDSLYFGANEPKTGAIESIDQFLNRIDLNHKVVFSGGHMQDESYNLLRRFFQLKRKKEKI